jgi:hypothetical protein
MLKAEPAYCGEDLQPRFAEGTFLIVESHVLLLVSRTARDSRPGIVCFRCRALLLDDVDFLSAETAGEDTLVAAPLRRE